MRILAIETSCDETAAAVVEDGTRIRADVVASQIDIHRRYGGIVPEVASRQHVLSIIPVYQEALRRAGTEIGEIDRIAVTYGPGLAGSLLVGVNFAKALAVSRGIPLYGINHMEAHVYANWLAFATGRDDMSRFPALCLIVSGGHTEMHLMYGHGQYRLLGRTRDDAAGEAFDKAARLLELGYPGGPAVQHAATTATEAIPLPRAWLTGTHDFSFSGLKTALWHMVNRGGVLGSPENVASTAAGFQEAVVDVLTTKALAAADEYHAACVMVSGGVAANTALRARLVEKSSVPVLIPPLQFCTDNAAMVAACAYFAAHDRMPDSAGLDIIPALSLA